MSPGGHLVCTALACGAVHALGGSLALTAGVAAGGVLINVDHVIDYVFFERRRELSPGAFLRYYVEQRHQRVVLVLHAYELLVVLAALAWVTGWVWLWGYLLGMALHLPLDIVFNGRVLSRNLVPFYSFAYRWRARFRSARAPRRDRADARARRLLAELLRRVLPRAPGARRHRAGGRASTWRRKRKAFSGSLRSISNRSGPTASTFATIVDIPGDSNASPTASMN